MYTFKAVVSFLLLILFMVSCSNPEKEFAKAKEKNNIEAYEKFIKKFPNSEFTNQAKRELENLEYNHALELHTVQSLEAFLSKYPESQYNKEIENEIQKIEYTNVKKINTIDAYKSLLNKYPNTVFKDSVIERIDLLKAYKEDKLKSFRIFLNKYPKSEFVKEVKKEIKKRQLDIILSMNYSDRNLNTPHEAQKYSGLISVMRSAMHGNWSLYPISEFIKASGHNIIWADSEKLKKYKNQIPNKYVWIHCKVINDLQGPLILEIITPGTKTNWTNKKGSLPYSEREGSAANDMALLLNTMKLHKLKLINRFKNFNFNSKEVQSYANSSNIFLSKSK